MINLQFLFVNLKIQRQPKTINKQEKVNFRNKKDHVEKEIRGKFLILRSREKILALIKNSFWSK